MRFDTLHFVSEDMALTSVLHEGSNTLHQSISLTNAVILNSKVSVKLTGGRP